MTIVEFLEARLAEDEADALAHHPGERTWIYDDGRLWADREARRRGMHTVAARQIVRGPRITLTSSVAPDAPSLRHIARHDPARVLREVEAKRQIIATMAADEETDQHAAEVLAVLASVYADHPDHDQACAR